MADAAGRMDALPIRIDALRASGAADRDPVRFAFLDALARRAAMQPAAIRQPLLAKLNALVDELAAKPSPSTEPLPETLAPSGLAELLAYISQHTEAQADPTPPPGSDLRQGEFVHAAVDRKIQPKSKAAASDRIRQGPELKSVAYFRNEWSRLSTEQQLTQTLAQAPENAGPMNSQHLVLRSLQLMRDIAPDYLQGFMSYIDTLIWLEQADPTKPASGRSATGEGEHKNRPGKRGAKNR